MCKGAVKLLQYWRTCLRSKDDTQVGISNQDGNNARGDCDTVSVGESVVKEYEFCRRCGRRLKTAEAREKGIGPVCEKKIISKSIGKLF